MPGVAVTAIHEATQVTPSRPPPTRAASIRLRSARELTDITAQLDRFRQCRQERARGAGRSAGGGESRARRRLSEETVTVTGAARRSSTRRSRVQASNINPRQLSELPINGRNWLDLTMLAAGSRVNTVSSDDLTPKATVGNAQLNVDGHQVTSTVSATGFGQPHYSQGLDWRVRVRVEPVRRQPGPLGGRAGQCGLQERNQRLHRITAGYFRSDNWNAADFIVNRVLPYSNQQFSTTFGGPIVKDKIHFFVNYEYEREPSTQTYTTRMYKFQPGPDRHCAQTRRAAGAWISSSPRHAPDGARQRVAV